MSAFPLTVQLKFQHNPFQEFALYEITFHVNSASVPVRHCRKI